MWTKSKDYATKDLPVLPAAPVALTPGFLKQASSKTAGVSDLMPVDDFNFVSCLSYSIIPDASSASVPEVNALLQWMFYRWTSVDFSNNVSKGLIELPQIEYFFFGTENGQCFTFPLISPATIESVVKLYENEKWCQAMNADMKQKCNNNSGALRLLHQHAREETVSGLHTLGTLVASCSSDRFITLSLFYPLPRFVVSIEHPEPLQCVRLWEGAPFLDRLSEEEREEGREKEAVYIFTGDQAATTRLWRVNVVDSSCVLLHIFVMSPSISGVHSSLELMTLEDNRKSPISRVSSDAVFCLLIDNDKRLLAGTEGGIYCWCLDQLAWKADKEAHPLTSGIASNQQLHVRIERLVNHHVWIRDSHAVKGAIEEWQSSSHGQLPLYKPTAWKPKHAEHVSNGRSVGVVANEVKVTKELVNTQDSLLKLSLATISFENNELRKDVVLPVCCIEPVVYPLQFLPTGMNGCFAMDVLEEDSLVVTHGSNGQIIVWKWESGDEQYVQRAAAQCHCPERAFGKMIAVLRTPDVFIVCGGDSGIVQEFHLHDGKVLCCERRFAIQTVAGKDGDVQRQSIASGINCLAAVPLFNALFVVGLFDSFIQTFRLNEVLGCEAPPNYLYNGFKTLRVEDLESEQQM